MNKTIYILSTINDEDLIERHGEVQFAFDANLNLLDGWSLNDADWREEYFNPFMSKLGFNVETEHPQATKMINEAAEKLFGS